MAGMIAGGPATHDFGFARRTGDGDEFPLLHLIIEIECRHEDTGQNYKKNEENHYLA